MLISLLRTYLAPYRRLLAWVTVLSLIGTMASLFLPTLNADIIDNGVAKGDTGYIWRTGGMMLMVSLVQIVCTISATYLGARTAMGFGRDVRGALFGRVLTFSASHHEIADGRLLTPTQIVDVVLDGVLKKES